ncbi:MAG: hypothetical protein AAGJ36_05480, partial [Pseudomonadota bacterium]
MDACATDLDAEAEQRLLQAARLSADSVAFTRLVSPHVAPIRRYLERFLGQIVGIRAILGKSL